MQREPLTPRRLAALAAVGALAGLMSGLFGVGGGLVVVPVLAWAGLAQKEAAATSMAAIIPISLVSVTAYARGGDVDWLAGLLLAVGFALGAQLGSRLLSALPERFLRWFFVVFILVIIATQLVSIPSRDATIAHSPVKALLLAGLGVGVGFLGTLLGLGGGAIMVPALAVAFGASDLIARGTSLLAMFPGAIAATVPNARRGLVDLRSGLAIGLSACLFTPLGNAIATRLSPTANTLLFASYLALILAMSVRTALRAK